MQKHARLMKLGLDTNPIFATKLISDYISFHNKSPQSLKHAHQLFDQVPFKDGVLWTSLISAYTRSGHPYQALRLFSLMLRQQDPVLPPNHFTFATVARAIASSPEYLHLGQTIHARVVKSGFIPSNVIVETAFVDMYAKACRVECARTLFDEMPDRNVVTWNAMIAGYVHAGMESYGLGLFYWMKCGELYAPDEFTVATVFLGCAWVQNLHLGTQVHGYSIVTGIESNCVNAIGNMYFSCGEVNSAERVLDRIEEDAILKLIKIRGYVFNQRYNDSLKYVSHDQFATEIFYLDYTAFVPMLTACARLNLPRVGKQVHGLLILLADLCWSFPSLGEDNMIIVCALIDMYSKSGSVSEARKIFDLYLPELHVPVWNSMISGYIHNNLVEDARALLDEIPEKNVVSCTSMISGYVQSGMPQEGLKLLAEMFSDKFGVQGNCLTFVVALEACSKLTNLEKGKQIHAKLIRALINADITNVAVGTALVDMYSKSGCLDYAQKVFNMMLEKNVVAWTSIISGYAVHGFGFKALEIFQQMIEMGEEPNEVTFVSILTACSHCGLVDEGLLYMKLMKEKYRLVPREDHYTCLIDMLGRVGRLEEAWSLLEEFKNIDMNNGCFSGTMWAAMLGACWLHGNVEMGSRVSKKMLECQKQDSSTYVTISNIYAGAGMWKEACRLRDTWKKEGVFNGDPGLSCLHLA